jgi:hypothetical protein
MSNRVKLAGLAAAVALTGLIAARVSSEPFSRQYPKSATSLRQPPPPPLDRVIPEVRLDSMPLEDLLEEIGRLAGVEIKPDWKGLKEDSSSARVYPGTHVNVELRLRNVTLGQVLAKVSESMDHCELLVARPAEDGTVRILHAFSPSAEPPAEAPVARYYDVRSLLREVDFTPHHTRNRLPRASAPRPRCRRGVRRRTNWPASSSIPSPPTAGW